MAHPRMYDDSNPAIKRLRKICAGLPRVVEKEAWGECTFRIEGGTMFAMTNNHPGKASVVELWVKAPPMVQEILVGSTPETFFKPPYVGHKGWVGIRLGGNVDWKQVAEILEDGYRLATPKKLQAKMSPTAATRAATARRGPRSARARARS